MEAWELSKENYVPVRTGRGKAALQELADPADSGQKHALQQRQRDFQQEIREYTGDDVLEVWTRYIKWAQEHLTGAGKHELQSVLESCTKELTRQPRYSSDVRALRIWVQYADCLPDPADVFLFLKEKQLGQEFALFYEAYATYYELRGDCTAADAVYSDGINKQAKPLERLRSKYVAFQNRMAQRIQRKMQEEALMGPSRAPSPPRVSLSMLPGPSAGSSSRSGGLHSSTSRHPNSSNSVPQGLSASGISAAGTRHPQSQPYPSQQAQQQPQTVQAPTLSFLSRPGGSSGNSSQPGGSSSGGGGGGVGPASSVAVHVDEEFEGGGRAGAPLPSYSTMPVVNNLRELKPYTQVRKENLDAPTAWAGRTLPQSQPQVLGPSVAPKLEIFTDEEFQEEEEPVIEQSETAPPRGGLHARPPLPSTASMTSTSQPALSQPKPALPPPPKLSFLKNTNATAQQQPPPFAAVGTGTSISAQLLPSAGGLPKPCTAPAPLTAAAAAPATVVAAVPLKSAVPINSATATSSHSGHSADVVGKPAYEKHGIAASAASTAAPAGASFQATTSAFIQLQPAADTAFNVATLVDDAGQEVSYMELRARAWLRRHGPPAPPSANETAAASMPSVASASIPHLPTTCSTSAGADAQAAAPLLPPPQTGVSAAAAPSKHNAISPAAPTQTGTQTAAQQPACSAASTALSVPSVAECPAPSAPSAQAQHPLKVLREAAAPMNAAPAGTGSSTGGRSARAAFGMLLPPQTAPAAAVPTATFTAPTPAAVPAPSMLMPATAAAPKVTASSTSNAQVSHPRQQPLVEEGPPTTTHHQHPSVAASHSQPHIAAPYLTNGNNPAPPWTSSLHTHSTSAAPLPEPTITMSTRAAFDAVNAMFCDDREMGGMMEPSGNSRKRLHEPTVTMNTKAAFDALNDMFSDALPHETAGGGRNSCAKSTSKRLSSLPVTSKPISALDVCRLANTGKPSASFSQPTNPTQPGAPPPQPALGRPGLGGGAASSGSFARSNSFKNGPLGGGSFISGTLCAAGGVGGPGSFMVYEDTDFAAPQQPTSVAAAVTAGTAVADGQHSGTALHIYEDTDFAVGGLDQQGGANGGLAAGGADTSTLPHGLLASSSIYQDTEFLPASLPLSISSSIVVGASAHRPDVRADRSRLAKAMDENHRPTMPLAAHIGSSSGAADSSGAIYEDTEFVQAPAQKERPQLHSEQQRQQQLQQNEQTAGPRQPVASTRDSMHSIYQDTEFLPAPAAAPRVTLQVASASSNSLEMYQDTEFLLAPQQQQQLLHHPPPPPASLASTSNHNLMHGVAAPASTFGMYQDTEFLLAPQQPQHPLEPQSQQQPPQPVRPAALSKGGRSALQSQPFGATAVRPLNPAPSPSHGMYGDVHRAPAASLGMYEDTELLLRDAPRFSLGPGALPLYRHDDGGHNSGSGSNHTQRAERQGQGVQGGAATAGSFRMHQDTLTLRGRLGQPQGQQGRR